MLVSKTKYTTLVLITPGSCVFGTTVLGQDSFFFFLLKLLINNSDSASVLMPGMSAGDFLFSFSELTIQLKFLLQLKLLFEAFNPYTPISV